MVYRYEKYSGSICIKKIDNLTGKKISSILVQESTRIITVAALIDLENT